MGTSAVELAYEELTSEGELLCVALTQRKGRHPIRKAEIASSGEVIITGSDNTIEVLGSPQKPCSEAIIKRMRTHHEGLLVVEFAEHTNDRLGPPVPVNECLIRDSFFSD